MQQRDTRRRENRPIGQDRRRALTLLLGAALGAGTGAASSGCAPTPSAQAPQKDILFVSLGSRSAVGIFDPPSGKVVAAIDLAPIGWTSPAGKIVAGPGGTAVLLPLSHESSILGIVRPISGQSMLAQQRTLSLDWEVTGIELAELAAEVENTIVPPVVLDVTIDGQGTAYALLGDRSYRTPTSVVLVDLASGERLGSYQVAPEGESITALAVTADGRYLHVGRWTPDPTVNQPATWMHYGCGSFATLDAHSGRLVSQIGLPEPGAVRALYEATLPAIERSNVAGSIARGGTVLFAAMFTPETDASRYDGPTFRGDTTLLALDPASLEVLDLWRLEQLPRFMTLPRDGQRLYFLGNAGSATMLRLDSINLRSGGATKHAEIRDGVGGMAQAANGDIFLLDAYGRGIIRFDPQRQRTTGTVTLDVAPIAVAAW